jgi:hypothetical protein
LLRLGIFVMFAMLVSKLSAMFYRILTFLIDSRTNLNKPFHYMRVGIVVEY